ncbi:MAG: NADH-quinone oxidoreductase subunit NuoG [Desulfobacterales bacterium]|nr:NADH-quinone oxidoreductase subunit NuoG [Desulfobacterales bacterium]
MPKIVIDDIEIEVAPKTTVIEAAAQLGIMIPRFCYHPALGSVGACRVCAVKFLEGPLKGIQMSCMVEAQDGMVVSTTDKEAADFRKSVIEWLMLHHPHDCPVCDAGGHCLLQDMTVSGGHGIRRYAGPKRTYHDQYLGPLIQHEMNRCIHCYRCSRFYQEFTGYTDLGVMRNANHTYFGRFEDGILESPFTGNLSDICPTGVYTDKPSRYFGRRWDYQRQPSLCVNCSLGCHTIASVKYREVKRQEARFSRDINGHFICDRGRYGFFYASLDSRPREASVNGNTAPYDEALQAASTKLGQIEQEAGTDAIAILGSGRSSLETQAMVKLSSRLRNWRSPAYFMDSITVAKVRAAINRLETGLTVSMRDVESADLVLCIGADPMNEAPMLALAMRQAQCNGAQIVVADPRPISLPMTYQHLPVAATDLYGLVGSLIESAVDRQTASQGGEKASRFYDALPDEDLPAGISEDLFTALVDRIKDSRQPVIVCGTDVAPLPVNGIAADLALYLKAAGKNAGLFYLLPGANAFGAGLLSDSEVSLQSIVEAIEGGQVKALITVESNPLHHFPDRQRLIQALDKLDLLIVLDYLDTDALEKAHFFFPSTTLYESNGIFVNQEGRAQVVQAAYVGGLPIVQSGGGNHPPRIYGRGVPGVGTRPARQILADLAGENFKPEDEGQPAAIYGFLAEIIPELAIENPGGAFPENGIQIHSGAKTDSQFASDQTGQDRLSTEDSSALSLVLTDLTFGSEELSGHSECLFELEPEPAILLHSSDAAKMNLADGSLIAIETAGGSCQAKLKVIENMASGVVIVPRHRKLAWQIFAPGTTGIGRDQIKKAQA